jgi:transcription antitermination factor NusG
LTKISKYPTLENNMECSEPLGGGPAAWFALQVKTRHERVIADHLVSKGYEAFAPLAVEPRGGGGGITSPNSPLFPGYVFSKFDPRFRLPILTTPKVRSIVGYGRSPAPIPVSEIQAIRDVSRLKLAAEPCTYLTEGARVRITRGPLKGVQGILVQFRSSYRVVLSVSLIRQSIRIEMDPSLLAEDPLPQASRWYQVAS